MWDMEDRLAIASSRSLGCTTWAITTDTKLLVAGGADGFLQYWRAVEGHPHLFDITGPINQICEFRLWEDEDPVACFALDIARIYSESRFGKELTLSGSNVASSAGNVVYVETNGGINKLTSRMFLTNLECQ